MRHFIFLLTLILLHSIIFVGLLQETVFAQEEQVKITFDPQAANFSTNQQNIIYIVLTAIDTISASDVSLIATGGVKILDLLSPVDENNTPLSQTKLINKKVASSEVSATILMVKNTVDLPHTMKIPVVITSMGSSGNLKIDTAKSQIVNASGNTYVLSLPKPASITFSNEGKNNIPVPSPTSLAKDGMTVAFMIKLQGTNSVSAVKKTLDGFTIQFIQKNGTSLKSSLPFSLSLSANQNGMWGGSTPLMGVTPGGNYQLLIKGPKYLQKRICDSTPTEAKEGVYACANASIKLLSGENILDFSNISLMAGDLGVQDGILNTYDLSVIQNAIRKTSIVPVEEADLTYDGKIDKKDYDLLIYTLANTSGLDQK